LSRRALEKRFRRFLKHSVLNEIRRVRTDQIARLLAETELPVAQIALDLGFDDVQHVSRYFRAVRGLTPLAYRKAHGRAMRVPARRDRWRRRFRRRGIGQAEAGEDPRFPRTGLRAQNGGYFTQMA